MRQVEPNTDPTPVVIELSADEFRDRLHEALSIYVAAMGYPRGTEYHRAPMWSEHIGRRGWRGVGALTPDTGPATATADEDVRLVAVAYGYSGAPEQWWHQQVRTGLRHTGWPRDRIDALLGNYFELTELHVHPDAQGHGLGETLLLRLLEHRPEQKVLLSTPEVTDEDNRAWRLYRRLGFEDVLRHFRFAGDNRPFAVLGRTLPL
ncbi:MAG: GNAT family N-acetyltransferase [Rhodococcus sp. (in: high G+C Gram-positive bacteria)]|uniref:GNAT family N-acetyltransferase n=1 Tax=Rhodococcus sp. TaxID=1831 RepID=UPI003BAF4334